MTKDAVGEWSTTASSNTDIAGIDIAENCSPANLNDAIRTLMAQVAVHDALLVKLAGAQTVTGNKTFSGTSNFTGPLQIGGTAVTSTATELNLVDGLTAIETTITNTSTALPTSGAVVSYAGARPTASAGAGNFVAISPSSGAAYTLPAGGTWAWFAIAVQTSTGLVDGALGGAGVASGGTTVLAATTDRTYRGFAWRVA